MISQKLNCTYMLNNADLAQVKYEVYTGGGDCNAFITIFDTKPNFHIKCYDFLKLNEKADIEKQIEEHFAETYL